MLRDITLGQYYPVKSKIHELDPRVKLVATLIYIISLFILNNPIGFALATIFLIIAVKMSKVPFSFMVKGLRAIIILMLFTAVLNMVFTPGEEIFRIWKISISFEGVRAAGLMMIRLCYLIIGTSIMTLTTTPNRLTDGLESLLKGLNKVKVPVHEIALMMSIALRFIPILVEETDKIMKAQMARGADFESGGLIKKTKSLLPVLVPLFISAFRRANDLALAMESRCYMGGEGRTRMKPLKYSAGDIRTYILLFIYLILMIISRIIWGRLF